MKLKDITELIVDSEHKTAPTEKEGYPYIRTPNIGRGRLILDDVRRISKESYKKWTRRAIPKKNDLILAREAPVGNVAIVTDGLKPCLGQRTVLIRPNAEKVYPNYLVYLLLGDEIQERFHAVSTGSTVPHLNMSDIRGLDLPQLPPYAVQQKIASILSAFDDLIENNTRRIAILEEMARLIYREWFVHYRYPGHENGRLVDSGTELGDVPEGWSIAKIDELVSSQYGYTESASEDKVVGPKFIRGTDINKTSYINWPDVPYCPINDKDYEKFKVNIGDILVIRMADPGKLCIIEENKEAVFASYLIRLVINDERITPYYLFYLMSDYDYQGYITGASTGTTRKSASAKVVKDYKIVIPPIELQKSFVEQISTLRNQLNTLLNQSNTLKETRDILLPKLISGKVGVY